MNLKPQVKRKIFTITQLEFLDQKKINPENVRTLEPREIILKQGLLFSIIQDIPKISDKCPESFLARFKSDNMGDGIVVTIEGDGITGKEKIETKPKEIETRCGGMCTADKRYKNLIELSEEITSKGYELDNLEINFKENYFYQSDNITFNNQEEVTWKQSLRANMPTTFKFRENLTKYLEEKNITPKIIEEK